MLDRLRHVAEEYHALTRDLADPAVLADPAALARVGQRVHELRPVVEAFEEYQQVRCDLDEAEALMRHPGDPELRGMAEDEVERLRPQLEALEAKLRLALVPRDPADDRNVVLEIRAGTGGEEAGLFAADLYRMYLRYAEIRGWRVEEVERNETGLGGLREAVAVIEGHGVFRHFKFESGVHRVQRVPETESQGRIHTSAVTVAVLPEAEEVEIEIDPKDLRIDTYRASGAGGQHVNKTDSAVRITHVPSGVVVACQDERSQHKNRDKAMRILRARLLEARSDAATAERADARRAMVGTGDRSERIRTYNFPQNRVTDHRINLTLHRLPQILEGDLDELIGELMAADAAARLAAEGGGS